MIYRYSFKILNLDLKWLYLLFLLFYIQFSFLACVPYNATETLISPKEPSYRIHKALSNLILSWNVLSNFLLHIQVMIPKGQFSKQPRVLCNNKTSEKNHHGKCMQSLISGTKFSNWVTD